MAQYHSVGKSTQLVSCPYNISHRVEEARLPYHITKCARNHLDVKLIRCPFNARHMFTKEHEYNDHMTNVCPDRVIIDREVFQINNRSEHLRGNLAVPPYQTREIESEENWDEEANPSGAAGYDPRKARANTKYKNPVILSDMKPAQKRAFHAGFTEQEEEEKPQEPALPRPRANSEQLHKVLKELRLPVAPPQVVKEAEATRKSKAKAASDLGATGQSAGQKDINATDSNAQIRAMAKGRGILSSVVRPPPGFTAQS